MEGRRFLRSTWLSIKDAFYRITKRWVLRRYSAAAPGTLVWLVGTEVKYGGIVRGVPRHKVSPRDPRTARQVRSGGMVGGDRMLHNGYASKYAEYLLPYVHRGRRVTLAEFGILEGTGLAVWCDLFRGGRILGLDIDLGHIQRNMDNLKRRGAFRTTQPELYELDQFLDNTEYLGAILRGEKLDICIDDGFHSRDTILNTLKSAMPHLADDFVYFIEDNRDVHREIRALFPAFTVDSSGKLTVVSARRE